MRSARELILFRSKAACSETPATGGTSRVFAEAFHLSPDFKMIRRLFFVLAAAAGIACSQQPGGDAGYFGVWWRGGANAASLTKRCPWIKGVFVAIQWKNLEPADNQFDWKSFD